MVPLFTSLRVSVTTGVASVEIVSEPVALIVVVPEPRMKPVVHVAAPFSVRDPAPAIVPPTKENVPDWVTVDDAARSSSLPSKRVAPVSDAPLPNTPFDSNETTPVDVPLNC